MADEAATRVRTIVEKMLEADVTEQLAQRTRELSAAMSEATDTVSARAVDAWKESRPARRDAGKALRGAGEDVARWGRTTWRRDLHPALRRLWNRRTVALGAAGAAVPAGRELIEDAAVRAGIIERREERRWAAFFLGIVIGAAVGAIVALLTTPRPGREMRKELEKTARDAAGRAREAAEKATERAREAAGGAGDWVPLFERGDEPEGGETAQPADSGSEGEDDTES